MRTLNLPEEIQDRIAARELKRVPEGKIDYRTALDIAEKIKDPERQVEVATQLAEERMPREVAREVIRRAATETPQPVAQIVQEAVREPRASLAFTASALSVRRQWREAADDSPAGRPAHRGGHHRPCRRDPVR